MFGRLKRCQNKSRRQLYPTCLWCCTHKPKKQGDRQWTLSVTSLWVCFYQRTELSHLVRHAVWTVDPKIAVFILLGSPLFKIRITLPHYFVAYTTCINAPLSAVLSWIRSLDRRLARPSPGSTESRSVQLSPFQSCAVWWILRRKWF